jgi:hypothetical protein
MEHYAEIHKLVFDGEYLYAYRNHDQWDRGAWNKTIRYDEKKYYRDWRCNLNANDSNSFGLGIWPTGNTAVKVSVEDWGTEVYNSMTNVNGKARVFGFTII